MVVALYLAYAAILIMGGFVLAIRKKTLLYKSFFMFISCLTVWSSGFVLDRVFKDYLGCENMVFAHTVYLGTTFAPIALWVISLVFKNPKSKLSKNILWALVIPVLSNIILWTNDYHHLFYRNFYDLESSQNVYGWYFILVDAPYSYLFTLLWVKNIIQYAVKNRGVLTKQVTIVVTGTLVSVTVNMLFTFGVIPSAYINIVGFAFMLLCYLIAIRRYGFLNIVPLAKEKIIDDMTDCFVILGPDHEVQNFNKPFVQTFGEIFPIKLMDNFTALLSTNKSLGITPEYFNKAVEKSIARQPNLPLIINIAQNGSRTWFSIEIACVGHDKNVGTIVTFKDITYIKQHEFVDTEQTRLRGLVQMSGDLAHDINSPLSLARNITDRLSEVVAKMKDNPQEFVEQNDWLVHKLQVAYKSCERSLRVANKIMDQVGYIYFEPRKEFNLMHTLINAAKRQEEVYVLLREFPCKLVFDGDDSIIINSYPDNLARVVTNIVKNSIESYKNKPYDENLIEISFKKEIYNSRDMVLIQITDHAEGMDNELQKLIFKTPLKFKNLKKDGGGISLFIAPIIATGQLEGEIWFESTKGQGTTFYIRIPIECSERVVKEIFV